MIKKFFALFLLTFILLLTFTCCGNTGTPAPTPVPPATPIPTHEPTPTPEPLREYELLSAERDGLITAYAVGSSISRANITVKNISDKSIAIQVGQGTYLFPDSDEFQNMLVL